MSEGFSRALETLLTPNELIRLNRPTAPAKLVHLEKRSSTSAAGLDRSCAITVLLHDHLNLDSRPTSEGQSRCHDRSSKIRAKTRIVLERNIRGRSKSLTGE